jgi:hypothetical protein
MDKLQILLKYSLIQMKSMSNLLKRWQKVYIKAHHKIQWQILTLYSAKIWLMICKINSNHRH